MEVVCRGEWAFPEALQEKNKTSLTLLEIQILVSYILIGQKGTVFLYLKGFLNGKEFHFSYRFSASLTFLQFQ